MSNVYQPCCSMMAAQVAHHCEQHQSAFDCPDALVAYNARFDEYGLIIHDGGTAVVSIAYCPWCGTALPESKCDRWFAELEALGFDDPATQPVPHTYTTAQWYRETNNADRNTEQR